MKRNSCKIAKIKANRWHHSTFRGFPNTNKLTSQKVVCWKKKAFCHCECAAVRRHYYFFLLIVLNHVSLQYQTSYLYQRCFRCRQLDISFFHSTMYILTTYDVFATSRLFKTSQRRCHVVPYLFNVVFYFQALGERK